MISWIGYDDNRDLEVSVGGNAKKIWANTVERVSNLRNLTDNWYHIPNNVVGILLNAIDGKPTTDINKATMFYFLKGSEPKYNIDNYLN